MCVVPSCERAAPPAAGREVPERRSGAFRLNLSTGISVDLVDNRRSIASCNASLSPPINLTRSPEMRSRKRRSILDGRELWHRMSDRDLHAVRGGLLKNLIVHAVNLLLSIRYRQRCNKYSEIAV